MFYVRCSARAATRVPDIWTYGGSDEWGGGAEGMRGRLEVGGVEDGGERAVGGRGRKEGKEGGGKGKGEVWRECERGGRAGRRG